jgi:hypothetical protein
MQPMRNADAFRRSSTLPFQEIEGRVIIVVPERRQMHLLDEVGTYLWNLLGVPRSSEDLTRSLCEEFEVEPPRARKDVEAFLAELGEKGLLKTP